MNSRTGSWLQYRASANILGATTLSHATIPVLYGYEFLLTLPDEVSEIWSSKWSLPKVAYLMSRYGGLAYWAFYSTAELIVSNSVSVRIGFFFHDLSFLIYLMTTTDVRYSRQYESALR